MTNSVLIICYFSPSHNFIIFRTLISRDNNIFPINNIASFINVNFANALRIP